MFDKSTRFKQVCQLLLSLIVDPFKQVKSAEHMAKNQFQVHSVVFCHADVKM